MRTTPIERFRDLNIHATTTGRVSSADVNESNTPKAATEEEFTPSITWLNMTGDITITWTEENREKMLELIRQKMKDGYNFFTTKKVPIIGVERKVRVSNKNIDTLEKLVIPDNEFDKLVAGMNDKEVAALVHAGDAKMAKRKDNRSGREMLKRLEHAEEVLRNQSLAVRPVVGG